MSEAATVDVVAALGPTGHPIFGECHLHLGDGTVVHFVQGRAKVTPDEALRLVGRKDLHVLAPQEEYAPPAASETPDIGFNPNQAADDPPPPSDADRARDAARAELAAQGADVPDFPIPSGFATHTADEARRCLAAKGDGSQCANAAKPGTWACSLGVHVTKVDALPRQLP